jgi:hypothetical protein
MNFLSACVNETTSEDTPDPAAVTDIEYVNGPQLENDVVQVAYTKDDSGS